MMTVRAVLLGSVVVIGGRAMAADLPAKRATPVE